MGWLGVGKGKRKWKKKKWWKPKNWVGQVRRKKSLKEMKKKVLISWKGIFGHSGEGTVTVHEMGIWTYQTILSLKWLILGFVFFFYFMIQHIYIILTKKKKKLYKSQVSTTLINKSTIFSLTRQVCYEFNVGYFGNCKSTY